MLFLLDTALALTCAPDDAACNDANAIAAQINALAGTTVVADSGVLTRLQTGTIANRLAPIHAAALAGGCTIEGTAAALYHRSNLDGTWDQAGASGTLQGSYAPGSRTLTGTFAGDASGDIGAEWSAFEATGPRRHASSWGDDAFSAGGSARRDGKRGISWALIGTCPGSAPEALSSWFGALEAFVPPPDPTPPPLFLVPGATGGDGTSWESPFGNLSDIASWGGRRVHVRQSPMLLWPVPASLPAGLELLGGYDPALTGTDLTPPTGKTLATLDLTLADDTVFDGFQGGAVRLQGSDLQGVRIGNLAGSVELDVHGSDLRVHDVSLSTSIPASAPSVIEGATVERVSTGSGTWLQLIDATVVDPSFGGGSRVDLIDSTLSPLQVGFSVQFHVEGSHATGLESDSPVYVDGDFTCTSCDLRANVEDLDGPLIGVQAFDLNCPGGHCTQITEHGAGETPFFNTPHLAATVIQPTQDAILIDYTPVTDQVCTLTRQIASAPAIEGPWTIEYDYQFTGTLPPTLLTADRLWALGWHQGSCNNSRADFSFGIGDPVAGLGNVVGTVFADPPAAGATTWNLVLHSDADSLAMDIRILNQAP